MASTVLHYPGSKWCIARWIVSHLPPHTTYLEPFFGSGAVFFTKAPSHVETINDLDGDVVNLFRVIRDEPEELARLIEWTPWSRAEFQASNERGEGAEQARRFLVRTWMARQGSVRWKTGWRHEIAGRQGRNCARVWAGLPDKILAAAERLRGVQIENQDALKLIARYAKPFVLIYADPPYPMTTRNGTIYRHEMTDADHVHLLDLLDAHPGPAIVSGYACELYDERLKGWTRKTCRAKAEGGREREEVIWINARARAGIPQSLFD